MSRDFPTSDPQIPTFFWETLLEWEPGLFPGVEAAPRSMVFWEWPPFPAPFPQCWEFPRLFLVVNSDQTSVFWECWIVRDGVGAAHGQSQCVVSFPGILGGNFRLFLGIVFIIFRGFFGGGRGLEGIFWGEFSRLEHSQSPGNGRHGKQMGIFLKNHPKFPNFLTSIHHLE